MRSRRLWPRESTPMSRQGPLTPEGVFPHIPFPACGSYPVRLGNAVRPLIDGLPAFRRIGGAIEEARHSIWLTVAFYAPTSESRVIAAPSLMCSIARLIAASTFASYSGDQIRKAAALAALSRDPQPIAIYSDRGVRVSALAGIEHTDLISSIKRVGWSMRASRPKWHLSAAST
jgi:hypothetical protein